MQEFHSPAAWRGSELAKRDDWQHTLTAPEIAEIDRALFRTKRLRLAVEDIGVDTFPLPALGLRLRSIQDSLENGSGSFLLRGWPRHQYEGEDFQRVFWGLSRHIGLPISQSAKGEKLFKVQDAGFQMGHPQARGPNTSKELSFHCDRCDVIGFMCINQARAGGDNYLVSSVTVHNEMLARRPDLLELLYEPWYYKTHNVDVGNPEPWCRQPIFAVEDGHFVGYVLRVLIDRAYTMPEVPAMTAKQQEALDFLEVLCAEPALHYKFRQEPGDMLWVNNFVNFHSRSKFFDFEEAERKRLLLRIWLSVPNSRPLPALFAGSFGETAAGNIRGGIHPPRA